MATPDIEVLVGVLGGGVISGESGKKIENQLKNIMGHINKSSVTKLKITVDQTQLQKRIEAAIKAMPEFKINVGVNAGAAGGTGSGGTKGTQKTKQDLQEIINLQKLINKSSINLAAGKVGSNEAAAIETQITEWERLKQAKVEAYSAKSGKSAEAINAEVNANNKIVRQNEELVRITERRKDAEAKASAASVKRSASEENSIRKLTVQALDYYNLLKNAGQLQKNPEKMAQLFGIIEKANSGGYKGNIGTLIKDLKDFQIEAKKSGMEAETLGHWMSRVFVEKFKYGVITMFAYQARRAIRQIYTNVVELDTAMVELKKVTNETSQAYNDFLTGAASRAKLLGATLSDTVSATADFARLGFSMDDASEFADVALIYKNVGDGISDIGVASESIISTMQGFGIEADKAISIVDKFNIVGNNFAISSAGIGESLQRSAAAMSAAGNSIDETIALATAANTVLQNPDVVGEHMRPAA